MATTLLWHTVMKIAKHDHTVLSQGGCASHWMLLQVPHVAHLHTRHIQTTCGHICSHQHSMRRGLEPASACAHHGVNVATPVLELIH